MERPPSSETEPCPQSTRPRSVQVFDTVKKTQSGDSAAKDNARVYDRPDHPATSQGRKIGLLGLFALIACTLVYFVLFNA